MSRKPISHSPDLRRLRDEGYDIDVRSAYLIMRDVPYVNARREVKRGILVSTLRLAGDVTQQPDTHVAYFAGEPAASLSLWNCQVFTPVSPATTASGSLANGSMIGCR